MLFKRLSARRILNVLVAAFSLLFLIPTLLVVSLLIRVSSPGPIIFTQDRIGFRGKPFRMYKFRTMHVHELTKQVWAQKDDPRITRIGWVLRQFRIDEIPQLWNVLKGDMNVVGPRPEQPEIFNAIKKVFPDSYRRHVVLPGITGWAQVNNGYDQSFKDVEVKLNYDMEYISKTSVWMDIYIMFKTVPVMLGKRGAH